MLGLKFRSIFDRNARPNRPGAIWRTHGTRASRLTMSKQALAWIIALMLFGTASPLSAAESYEARVQRILSTSPVIDGHNDFPWEIRDRFKSDFDKVDLRTNTSSLPHSADVQPFMTDIPRLRKGGVGAQFWSAWVPADIVGPVAVQTTVEQIDVVSRMIARYPEAFAPATTAADIRRIAANGKIASLIGIEGGHQINNQLSVLRQMYDLGVRYMTLTHSSNVDWADSATDNPKHNGLTPFGKQVVREMNRLGMMVDLSHVSAKTMADALDVTKTPVIFSHSNARALGSHPRNVPDDILRRVKQNGGVVMVNFCSEYLSDSFNNWVADRVGEQARLVTLPYAGIYIGQPEKAAAALEQWDKAHPKPVVTIAQVADHIDHIVKVAGIDHVGIGSDFDGTVDLPVGLESTEDYPALLVELLKRGWRDADVAKLTSGNLLRVMEANEKIAIRLQKTEAPSNVRIESVDMSIKK
jgi:membrane dipeptidase